VNTWENFDLHVFLEATVREGVEVLEVPIKGCPVTTMEVSVKWGDNGNA